MPNRVIYRLNKFNLIVALWYCRLLYVRQFLHLPLPVSFSLRTTLGVFALLLVLPLQVLSLPVAVGGGLAFALVTE